MNKSTDRVFLICNRFCVEKIDEDDNFVIIKIREEL